MPPYNWRGDSTFHLIEIYIWFWTIAKHHPNGAYNDEHLPPLTLDHSMYILSLLSLRLSSCRHCASKALERRSETELRNHFAARLWLLSVAFALECFTRLATKISQVPVIMKCFSNIFKVGSCCRWWVELCSKFGHRAAHSNYPFPICWPLQQLLHIIIIWMSFEPKFLAKFFSLIYPGFSETVLFAKLCPRLISSIGLEDSEKWPKLQPLLHLWTNELYLCREFPFD